MASLKIVLVATVACVLVMGLHMTAATVNCPSLCTLEYAPLCARKADGTTKEFANRCALTSHECRNPGDIISSERGRCAPATTKTRR
ncbi:turripeptide OL11-like [Hetaerina americana]|uniref:turripeptide OL11-like n=1 Tax=Hetaerina americana TaxID=62018 RepID=UPI003A7F55B2